MQTRAPQPLFVGPQTLDRVVARRLGRATRLALFLDYDGTLAHIARTPEDAVLAPLVRSVLRALVAQRGMRIAIVTGRSLRQIRPMVRSLQVDLAVNHGLQIVSDGRRWTHPALQAAVPHLKTIARDVADVLGPIPGVNIENKRWSIGVHFRNVAARRIPTLRRLVRRMVRLYRGELTVLRGKMVLEIRPAAPWTKGDAILRLLSGPRYTGAFPVFIGDDRTDEDGFAVLAQRGLTIRVGRSRRTAAHYAVRTVQDVHAFLELLRSGQRRTHRSSGRSVRGSGTEGGNRKTRREDQTP